MTSGVIVLVAVAAFLVICISKIVNASNPANRQRRSGRRQGDSYTPYASHFYGSADASHVHTHHHVHGHEATTQPADTGFDAPTTQPSTDFSSDSGVSFDSGGGDCGDGGGGGGD